MLRKTLLSNGARLFTQTVSNGVKSSSRAIQSSVTHQQPATPNFQLFNQRQLDTILNEEERGAITERSRSLNGA